MYRYNPDVDAKPYMKDYELEIEPTDVKLLDAIIKLKAQDDSLSFRRSCREGICGSDGMNINGKNGLACLVDIRSLAQPIVLRPLPGLPVIRDLIVDMTQFFKQYHSIKPYVVNDTPVDPRKERLQSQEERKELEWLVRMHFVRLLFDFLPVVLVESRQIRRSFRFAECLPFYCR